MRITFYGAAGGVTGSKHLVEAAGQRILFDCGTFQGLPDVRERNRSVPFPPESISHVVLSHAHIDHCGMLPLLVKRGFTGSIFATPATKDVAQHMLMDMAGIEESDAEYRQRKHLGPPDEREPLFTRDDIPATMERFVEVPYARGTGSWHEVAPGVRLKLYDAGHILGSAVAVVEFTEGEQTRRVMYTGDLGAPGVPLLYDPATPDERVEVVITESTYGSLQHEPLSQAIEQLGAAINRVAKRGGKIIVPAFSLGRTQMLVYVLHKLTDDGVIPRLPIFVDSPLATDITEVFQRHSHDFDVETGFDFSDTDHTPLAFQNLTYTRSTEESKALNERPGPYIVISASGMMTAGRVVHHLRHSIADKKNAVFVTGYQARGTTGRHILSGASEVTLYGDRFPVRAEVLLFNEFSAHADRSQLTAYLERLHGVENVFLVHGEAEQADEWAEQLQQSHADWVVERPHEGEVFEL